MAAPLVRGLLVAAGVVGAGWLARRHESSLALVAPRPAGGRHGGPGAAEAMGGHPGTGGGPGQDGRGVDADIDVVVPARNEAAVIGACVAGLRAQCTGGALVVVDDGSDDATGPLARAGGATVLRLDGNPPPGWTGKTAAMVRGAAGGRAPWLAFVDADVVLEPGALAALATHARSRGLDAVSPLLAQRCGGVADSLLVPLAFWQHAVGMRSGGGAGPERSSAAVLNGQCLLVRRAAYEASGGHAHPSVRSTPLEDLALARLLASGGGRVALVRGDRLGTVRMYSSAGAVRLGFLKNAAEVLLAEPRRGLVVGACGALLTQVPGILLDGMRRRDPPGLAGAGLAWLVPAAVLRGRYVAAGVPGVAALAHPVAALALQALAVESLVRRALRRPASWKGRPLGVSGPARGPGPA